MKEEWKYKLQRSLADYEQSAPDGLWEDIQKAMSASAGVMQDAGKVIPLPGKNRTKVVAQRIAAAAACYQQSQQRQNIYYNFSHYLFRLSLCYYYSMNAKLSPYFRQPAACRKSLVDL